LYVDNKDNKFYAQAIKEGAIFMTKPITMACGERVGRVVDPFGSVWLITSQVEDVSLEEIQSIFGGCGK